MQRSQQDSDYTTYEARLRSFEGWPSAFVQPEALAAVGFYYTHWMDQVRCFKCSMRYCKWEDGDDPMEVHKRWSTRCPFLLKVTTTNCDAEVNTNLSITEKMSRLGISVRKAPVHPEYASYDARLESFKYWPISITQKAEQLADAGFYYTGLGDGTNCYQCGGGLRFWLPNEDPWEEHARWFPFCYYLSNVKGHKFINNMTRRRVVSLNEKEIATLPECIKKIEVSSTTEVEKEQQPSDNADDGRICKICYDEEVGVVFLPCAHIIACVKCAFKVSKCAFCRSTITLTVRVYFS